MTEFARISISSKQLWWLRDRKVLPDDLLGQIEIAMVSQKNGGLLSLDVVESVSDALTLALAEIGFDVHSELTADGEILEELIDRFTFLD
ncbi:hypothetical protein ASD53_04835 [Lysobacter sp. Root559]|uniref:hypothetical protein n=1 Tax=unclassified Lysobacter TaxID=2635362 RepID=UPI0006F33FFE|nr:MULTISPECIES: hypothetical protein [unclassified Lysobacter]KQZ59540.1 hypothetical protein ASD53_04835 [Lysobacter sp. Root559]KRA75793.1 hypothetical protein ASD78_07445 [Lysobacter sp. Root667]